MFKITPLIIYDNKHKQLWTHPDIATLATFEEGSEHDNTVHRIWLKDKKKEDTLVVIAKSPSLDEFWNKSFHEEEFKKASDAKVQEVQEVQEVVDGILMNFGLMLLDDVCVSSGEHSSPAHTKIGKLYSKTVAVQFSPDCGMWNNGDEWGYDT